MGVSYRPMEFLTLCSVNSKNRNPGVPFGGTVSFDKTIMLGRACFYASASAEKSYGRKSKKSVDRFLQRHVADEAYNRDDFFGKIESARAARFPDDRYAEPFFELLGAGIVDSMDCSDYEEATVIHDLCLPVPEELKEKYSCVFDGGVLNSVYEYTTALKNAMQMVSIGGHLILTTPGNNYFGHGFYQLSPELFYSVLCEENGFTDTYVYTYNPASGQWYYCIDPRSTERDTEVSPGWSKVQLCVISKKVESVPDNITAYQSKYKDMWDGTGGECGETGENVKKRSVFGNLKKSIYAMMPIFIRIKVKQRISFGKCFIKVRFWT